MVPTSTPAPAPFPATSDTSDTSVSAEASAVPVFLPMSDPAPAPAPAPLWFAGYDVAHSASVSIQIPTPLAYLNSLAYGHGLPFGAHAHASAPSQTTSGAAAYQVTTKKIYARQQSDQTKNHNTSASVDLNLSTSSSYAPCAPSFRGWGTLLPHLLAHILALATESSSEIKKRHDDDDTREYQQQHPHEWKQMLQQREERKRNKRRQYRQWSDSDGEDENEDEVEYPSGADSEGRERIDEAIAIREKMNQYIHIRKHIDDDMLQLSCINKHWHHASILRSAWLYIWYQDYYDDSHLHGYPYEDADIREMYPTSRVTSRLKHVFRISHYHLVGLELSRNIIFDITMEETLKTCLQQAAYVGCGLQQFIITTRLDYSYVGVPLIRLLTTPGLFLHLHTLEISYDSDHYSSSRSSDHKEYCQQQPPQSIDTMHIDSTGGDCLFPVLRRLILPIWPTTRPFLLAVSSHHMPSLTYLELSINEYDRHSHTHLDGIYHMTSLSELSLKLHAYGGTSCDDQDENDIDAAPENQDQDEDEDEEDCKTSQIYDKWLRCLFHPNLVLPTLRLSISTSLIVVIPFLTCHSGLCHSLRSLSLRGTHELHRPTVSPSLSLKQLTGLTSLYISAADVEDASIIAMELNHIKTLTTLELQICANGGFASSWSVSPWPLLSHLSISRLRDGSNYLIPLLQSCPTLKSLHLEGCEYYHNEQRFQIMKEAMQMIKTQNIKHITFKQIDFPPSSIPLLCSMSSLVSLSLSNSRIHTIDSITQLDQYLGRMHMRNKGTETETNTETASLPSTFAQSQNQDQQSGTVDNTKTRRPKFAFLDVKRVEL